MNALSPLTGVRVVEFDEGPAQYAGLLLSALGADVIVVEPSGGSRLRHAGPHRDGLDDGDHSVPFGHYNSGKRSITLDSTRDRDAVRALIGTADILLEGRSLAKNDPVGLQAAELAELAPGLIHVIVTPYGLTGPWANYQSSDIVAMALGGVTGQTGYDSVDGEPGSPITPVGHQARHFGGVLAATCAVSALRDRPASGVRTLDIALHDSIAVSTEIGVPLWEFGGLEVHRHTGRHANPRPVTPEWQVRCADGGYLCVLPLYLNDRRFATVVKWLDHSGFQHELGAERFATEKSRTEHIGEYIETLRRFCADRDSTVLYHEAQRRSLPWARIESVAEIVRDTHLQERGFFNSVEYPDGATVVHPGMPWNGLTTIYSEPGRRVRPPLAGEDTDAVLDEIHQATAGPARPREPLPRPAERRAPLDTAFRQQQVPAR